MASAYAHIESDSSFRRARKRFVFACTCRVFLVGVEYSVILPTVWLYLQKFDASTLFFGLVIASSPTASILALLLAGRIYDKTKRIREISIALNFLACIGNIIYGLPFSMWFLLLGRTIVGAGNGFMAIAVGEIGHLYPAKERTGILAVLGAGKNVGLVVGPLLNFALAPVNFNITESWTVDYTTSPALLIAVLWLIMQLVTVFAISNTAKHLKEVSPEGQNGTLKVSNNVSASLNASKEQERSPTYEDSNSIDDRTPLINPKRSTQNNTYTCENTTTGGKNTLLDSFHETTSSEFLVLAFTNLTLWLSQSVFEVLLPLLTEDEYNWTHLQLAILYACGAAFIIMIFLTIYAIGRKWEINDLYSVFVSLVLGILANSLLIAEAVLKAYRNKLVVFFFACVVVFTSIPLTLISIKALVTRLHRQAKQGFVQGVMEATTRIALALGPVLGSVSYHGRSIYGIIMSFACLFLLISCCIFRDRIINRQYVVSHEEELEL